MTDPIRDADANDPGTQASRTGFWVLHHRNGLRLALLILVVGFAAWGLTGDGGSAWDGATGFAIALVIAWGVMEILWFLIDRGSPDPIVDPEDQ